MEPNRLPLGHADANVLPDQLRCIDDPVRQALEIQVSPRLSGAVWVLVTVCALSLWMLWVAEVPAETIAAIAAVLAAIPVAMFVWSRVSARQASGRLVYEPGRRTLSVERGLRSFFPWGRVQLPPDAVLLLDRYHTLTHLRGSQHRQSFIRLSAVPLAGLPDGERGVLEAHDALYRGPQDPCAESRTGPSLPEGGVVLTLLGRLEVGTSVLYGLAGATGLHPIDTTVPPDDLIERVVPAPRAIGTEGQSRRGAHPIALPSGPVDRSLPVRDPREEALPPLVRRTRHADMEELSLPGSLVFLGLLAVAVAVPLLAAYGVRAHTIVWLLTLGYLVVGGLLFHDRWRLYLTSDGVTVMSRSAFGSLTELCSLMWIELVTVSHSEGFNAAVELRTVRAAHQLELPPWVASWLVRELETWVSHAAFEEDA